MSRLSIAALALVAAAIIASPCAAKHHQVTAEEASQFQVGIATYADVVGRLGKPTSVSTDSDGRRIIGYETVKARPKATSFVPIVNLFAGGTTGETYIVSFIFGPDGVLRKSSATEGTVNCTTHIFSVGCQGAGPAPVQAAEREADAAAPPPAPETPRPRVIRAEPAPRATPPRPAPKPMPVRRCSGFSTPEHPDALSCGY